MTAGQLYELTGPRLLSFAEAVEIISEATGRHIEYVSTSPRLFNSVMKVHGVGADYLWLLNYLFDEVLDGRNAQLADGVERALGRKPRTFADDAKRAAATGVWGHTRQYDWGHEEDA